MAARKTTAPRRHHRHPFGTEAEAALMARLTGARGAPMDRPARLRAAPAGDAEAERWTRMHSAAAAGG